MEETLVELALPPDVVSNALGVIESTRTQFRFPPEDAPSQDHASSAAGSGVRGGDEVELQGEQQGQGGTRGRGVPAPGQSRRAASGSTGSLAREFEGLGFEPQGKAAAAAADSDGDSAVKVGGAARPAGASTAAGARGAGGQAAAGAGKSGNEGAQVHLQAHPAEAQYAGKRLA